jgi:hypothetical protein
MTMKEALHALEEVKQAIQLAYSSGYSTGKQQSKWQGLTDEDVNRESAPITSQMKLAFHAGMYVAQKILQERNT